MLQLALEFFRRPVIKAQTAPTSFTWKHGFTVYLVRSLRAKRYLLRLNPDGSVRLTLPRRGAHAEAMRFLERSEAWLLQARRRWQSRRQEPRPWQDGTSILYRGALVVLRVSGSKLAFADQSLKLDAPRADYRPLIHAHLRALAQRELPPRVAALAREHGVAVQRITVRAQKTRWGSCSSRGAISLNWRLIHAPAHVIDYLIVHELMHRREMNHSARFWKQVAHAFPGYQECEAWLKTHRLESLG